MMRGVVGKNGKESQGLGCLALEGKRETLDLLDDI